MRQQVAQPPRIALRRGMLALKRKIVVRAETLEPRLAFVSFAPAAELVAHVLDLFPQKTRRAITAARLELHDRSGHFDNAGVEINRAAGGQLKGAPRSRHHFLPNESLGRSENYLRPPANIINEKAELRLETDDGARRRKMNPLSAFRSIPFYDSLHSRGTNVR
jgi:hypothetical protein